MHAQLVTPYDYIGNGPPDVRGAWIRCAKLEEDTVKYQSGSRTLNTKHSGTSIYTFVQTTRKFGISYVGRQQSSDQIPASKRNLDLSSNGWPSGRRTKKVVYVGAQ